MWTCKKCEKPVYFAERIQSLGFNWHPACLVCKECGKKLHPGQHAEHAAEPYCHHPCYGALFGPRLFGHGTRNECHGAFGKVNKAKTAERTLLESKVKEYNNYFDGKPGEITCREANGRVVLDGMVRVYWSVHCLIHLKQEDETASQTNGVCRSISNSSINNSGPASDDSDDEPLWRDDTPPSSPSTPVPSTPTPDSSTPGTPSHPNWPPTPYPTLRPSSSSSSISSLQEGPHSSPVLSYTHNAPPHAPLSHPASSLTAIDDSPNPLSLGGDAPEGVETNYATMKLRTVRRRKDVDKSVTQSLIESAAMMEALPLDANKNVKKEADLTNGLKKTSLPKRVSFSQVDCKPPDDNGNDGCNGIVKSNSDAQDSRKTPTRGKAVLRRRPGRRMDKKKVKRRCSINGHLYLRETSSFHLDGDCPPAVVRVTSQTSTDQLIATILEKYKIEMGAANFALYVVKDNGEQRKLTSTESPLTTRVMLGPHDNIAKFVLCDANTTSEITPQMAEFVHLSLAECRAILRQYEFEEQREIKNIRARYDEMKFYMQYWLEQMEAEGSDYSSPLITGV